MYVIGIASQCQMGKDTIGDHLCMKLNERASSRVRDRKGFDPLEVVAVWGDKPSWTRAAFAKNVKKVFCETFNVSYEFVEEWKVRPEPPPGFTMNVRQSLQFIGDGFRKIQGTIWLDLCFRDDTPKIISDVRYINEFTRVKHEGGLNVLVARPDRLNNDPNGSEAQIRPYVEWAMKKYGTSARLSRIQGDLSDAPEDMNLFDVYIGNDGTRDELLKVVEDELVPYVEGYKFKFPKEE